jgi:hypothetical protein
MRSGCRGRYHINKVFSVNIPPDFAEFVFDGSTDRLVRLVDHIGGFSQDFQNEILNHLDIQASQRQNILDVTYHQVLEPDVKNLYPHLKIHFDAGMQNSRNFTSFVNYRYHPELVFKHLICSFNGSEHVSRKLLVAMLERFGLFDPSTCSKNMSFSISSLDGHLKDLVGEKEQFYRKFFIHDSSADFFGKIYSFGHVRFDHKKNIYNLQQPLAQSFVHVVSESLSTSYVPYVTEKFLYSVVTRGLFLSYAQPRWHWHLEKYYGFKPYKKIFDYGFDFIDNPVHRLLTLISMIAKFRILTTDELHDLYELEKDTIEYNYDHYFSGSYVKIMDQANG